MQKDAIVRKISDILTRLSERKLRIAYQFISHLDR